jgi:hypothetical protein
LLLVLLQFIIWLAHFLANKKKPSTMWMNLFVLWQMSTLFSVDLWGNYQNQLTFTCPFKAAMFCLCHQLCPLSKKDKGRKNEWFVCLWISNNK